MAALGKTILRDARGGHHYFDMADLNTRFDNVAGVYVFLTTQVEDAERPRVLYVGNSLGFRQRFTEHRIRDRTWRAAREQGFNAIGTLPLDLALFRQDVTAGLIEAYMPPLNAPVCARLATDAAQIASRIH